MAENNNDLNLNEVKIFTGKTPDGIRQKCLQLCRDYLGGVWVDLSDSDFELERIPGGATNQLYRCRLADHIEAVGDEPPVVAVMIYGTKQFNKYICDGSARLSDVVVETMISELDLGPKIYGIFEGGCIMKFYKHRLFEVKEQKDMNLVRQMARKMARIHSLNVPLKKTTANWLFDTYDKYYNIGYSLFPIDQLIEECGCDTLKRYDLKLEIDWLKKFLVAFNSPVVFCHNDFRGSNIMVTEDKDPNNNDEKIVICDFEYACYGYRGFDFGHIFSEWGRTFRDYMNNLQQFPDDSVLNAFIDDYIAESVSVIGKSYSTDPKNSSEQISKEIKIFSFADNMFTVLVTFMLDPNRFDIPGIDKKHFIKTAEGLYRNYLHLKKKFTDEGTIDLKSNDTNFK